MSPRLLRVSGILLVLLGCSMAAVTAISDSQPAPRTFTGPLMPEDLPAHGFTLRDQHGRPFSLEETRGRVVAMTFIHSKCTSTCPVSLQTIRGALDDLGADRRDVDVLALTVDPEADTRRSVRRFLLAQHAGGFVRYLTGPRPQMRRIWNRYGIAPQGDGPEEHTAFVLLVDRKGLLRIGFPSHQMTPDELANDLQILLDEPA